MSEMDEVGVTAALRSACRTYGGESAWAESHGVSKQYVNKVLCGDVPPGPKILTGLRLRKVTRYVPTNGSHLNG